MAFAVLPLMLAVSTLLDGNDGAGDPVTLAAFHTVFNVLGVVLLPPFLTRFAAAIVGLVPDRGPVLTRHLDASLTTLTPLAIEAGRAR